MKSQTKSDAPFQRTPPDSATSRPSHGLLLAETGGAQPSLVRVSGVLAVAAVTLLTGSAFHCAETAPPDPSSSGDARQASEMAGAWVGGEVLEREQPDSQVNFFTLRPDGSLELSMIYEVGSRSRVWSYDIDVTYRDGAVSWGYHEGHLNPARDTMWVSKDYRGDRSEWMWVRREGADSLVARLLSVEGKPFEYRVPPEEGDGWACADPGSVGLDQEALFGFLDAVASGEFGDIHSFLVVRHDTLVVEEYFAESGSKHGAFVSSVFRDRVHLLASTTKPVVSALVGIAIENGFIGNVGDPISQFLPAHASLFRGGKEAITIEHLLTMSPGLAWSQTGRLGRTSDAQAVWETDDLVDYVLEKRLREDPGTRFRYSNGTAALMGAVLESATGMGMGRFAEENLFGPLGITDYEWGSYPDGTVMADGGLALRPRDLAKIGQMFLNHGRWDGVQVLTEDWVDRSTIERFRYGSVGQAPLGYGYFWNQAELPDQGGRLPSFFHSGSGGQFLIVIPELEMVVVFTGGIYGANASGTYLPIVMEYVLTSVDLPAGSRG